jgi:hypothetical protein
MGGYIPKIKDITSIALDQLAQLNVFDQKMSFRGLFFLPKRPGRRYFLKIPYLLAFSYFFTNLY